MKTFVLEQEDCNYCLTSSNYKPSAHWNVTSLIIGTWYNNYNNNLHVVTIA